MSLPLSDVEVRVLGALMEKDMATPEYYPLSLNALVNACNQKSNRDPVVSYGEEMVSRVIESLRGKGLAMVTTGGENRVPKYSHRIAESWNLGNRELAVLCELMLRGPQTAGELKGRAQRLHSFDDLGAVETCLTRLMEWQPEPLVAKLSRQPGRREARYGHLLSGAIEAPEIADSSAAASAFDQAPVDRLAALEAEIESLRQDLSELRREFADFRKEFE